MDYTIAVNVLWDLATGVFVGFLAYGGWLCLEHRSAANENEMRSPDSASKEVELPS